MRGPGFFRNLSGLMGKREDKNGSPGRHVYTDTRSSYRSDLNHSVEQAVSKSWENLRVIAGGRQMA
jgi:hypothetical protein